MALRSQHVAPELLNKVTKALGITALDQWYYVSHYAASKVIGSRDLNKFGGNLSSFLKYAYPQHQFDEEKLGSKQNLEKDQKFIEVIIRKLFPNEEIQTKARKAVGIVNPETEAYLEIDFWIPSLKLGIEYQDRHHYGYQWYANKTLEEYQTRDGIKKAAMSEKGYTLITIGHWWDKSFESIAATIREHRPDLLQEYKHIPASPILSKPQHTDSNAAVIPGVVGIMSPFVPTSDFNPTNWYGGEKHDGIRGIFNPELFKLFSRSGNELSVPSSLLKDIPNMLVEGEIIAGRGNYNKTTALSYHTNHGKVNWPTFRYIMYDIPDAESGSFTQRYSSITYKIWNDPHIFSQLAFRVLLTNKAHLKTLVDTILSDSGEGVIAQQDARYEYGRAKGLAKIKVRRDADARVMSVDKLSSACKLVSGVIANIYFCADFDPSTLKVGDIISYYHNGYSRVGLPKRGEIYKVRYDISWDQLISDQENVARVRPVKEAVGSRSLVAHSTARQKGHWNKSANVRAFFDEFAQTAGFDPLLPENWYQVGYSRILQNFGGSAIFKAYNFNLPKALSHAYPELKFNVQAFRLRATKGYWTKSTNVRAFFNQFARTAGFDSHVPENWYSVRTRTVQQAGGSLLNYYSLTKALSFAYPELKFDDKRFQARNQERISVGRGYWKQVVNARSFFDSYARNAGFDPLVPKNWYPVRAISLRKAVGGGLLSAYGNDIKKALARAYPELVFENKFTTQNKTKASKTKGYWSKVPNVRSFFDGLATTVGFDPHVPENWYSVSLSAVRNAGGNGLLKAYKFSIKNALSLAFPELNFEGEH